MRPGGTCSAFPSGLRQKVINVWEPIARVYQAFGGFLVMSNVSIAAASGPLVPIFAPAIFFSLLLNVLPYLVVELLIECNPSEQVKRQARVMRQNLDVLRMLPANSPIPGFGDIRRAVDLLYPFVSAAERGESPSIDAVNQMVSAAGILDGVPPGVLGGLLAAVEVTGTTLPAPARVNLFSVADAQLATKTLSREAAIARAKVKAKAEIEAKAKENAKQRAIAEAKVKAKAEIEAKARAGKVTSGASVAAAAKEASEGPPWVAIAGAAVVVGVGTKLAGLW